MVLMVFVSLKICLWSPAQFFLGQELNLSVATNTGLSSKFFFCFCLNCSSTLQSFCKSGHLGVTDSTEIGSVERHHDKDVDLYDNSVKLKL